MWLPKAPNAWGVKAGANDQGRPGRGVARPRTQCAAPVLLRSVIEGVYVKCGNGPGQGSRVEAGSGLSSGSCTQLQGCLQHTSLSLR